MLEILMDDIIETSSYEQLYFSHEDLRDLVGVDRQDFLSSRQKWGMARMHVECDLARILRRRITMASRPEIERNPKPIWRGYGEDTDTENHNSEPARHFAKELGIRCRNIVKAIYFMGLFTKCHRRPAIRYSTYGGC